MRGCPKKWDSNVLDCWGLYAILDKREWGTGVWDFKGKGNLQVDEKEWTCGKQILAGPPRNNGTQKEVQQTGFARFLCLPRLIYIRMLRWCSLPLRRFFYLISFRPRVKGKGQRFFHSLFFLTTSPKSIFQKAYFGVAKTLVSFSPAFETLN